MGTTNGVTRGQLRPHFAGRNPPFLVAALCVGIAILAVSYWSLCSQYNDLELQLKNALQRKESIENSEIGVKKQLLVREDEFSKVKVDYQRKEQEITDLATVLKAKSDELTACQSKLESNQNKCNEQLKEKDSEIGDINSKHNGIEQQNKKLLLLKDENAKHLTDCMADIDSLRKQLKEANNCNETHLTQPISEINNNGLESPNQVNNQPIKDSLKESMGEFISSPNQFSDLDENAEKKSIEKPLPLIPRNETAISDTQDNRLKQAIITDLNSKPDQQKNVSALGENDKIEDSLVDAGPPGVVAESSDDNK